MTSKLTRAELLNIIETDHVQCGEASALARMALAAMDSEPVCFVSERNLATLTKYRAAVKVKAEPVMVRPVALYRHVQQPVVPDAAAVYAQLSDHEKWSTSLENVNHVLNAFRAAMLAAAPQEVK
ncbi:hypothetical protein [Klebsiella sp. CN_Kp106]|uniref:hypothetical protein n=1 Tax=Klebsiella sp. CN_Kp106 TaxID=3153425 RepID=UPI0032B5660D